MKTLLNLLIALFVAVSVSSCVVPSQGNYAQQGGGGYNPYQGQQHRPMMDYGPQQQGGGRQLESVRRDKFEAGTVQVLLENYPTGTSEEKLNQARKATAEYASGELTAKRPMPSSEDLSEFATKELGVPVRAQARTTNPRHKVVESRTIKAEDLPEDIRAYFERPQQ